MYKIYKQWKVLKCKILGVINAAQYMNNVLIWNIYLANLYWFPHTQSHISLCEGQFVFNQKMCRTGKAHFTLLLSGVQPVTILWITTAKCCYLYLGLYIDICSLSEEDLSCLCVPIPSCRNESCDTILTRGEGGGERCDGERTWL